MYKATLSKDIFETLMSGKIINRDRLNNAGQKIQNPYFLEIIENLESYRTQYAMSGFELVVAPAYVFVRELSNSRDDLKTDPTMKIAILLLMIGKFVIDNNYRMEKLTDCDGGISKDDINDLTENDDIAELIEKAKLKSDLFSEIKSTLINRNVLFEIPGTERYILSNAGSAFFDEVVKNYIGDSGT